MADEFFAGGHTFRLSGFDKLTSTQQVVLETIVELTLQQRIPPSIRQVLRSIKDKERSTLRSVNSVQAMQRAINVLVERSYLEQTVSTAKTVCYWPSVLQVVPRAEFLGDEKLQQ